MKPILECHGLSKQYNRMSYALQNLNLALEPGQIVGLLGPNGSGKTTLIKLINDLLVPTEGQILIDGKTPGVETKKIVSYLPERSCLDESMRIKEILRYFADFYQDFSTEKADAMLRDLEIDPAARLRTLSKGSREKVQLVLVMSRDARLYVLDEPIGGVDPAARDYILRTILSNYREDATVLLSTHLIYEIENILDRVLFLRQGQIVLNAGVDEIRTQQGKSVDTLFREVFRC
ncbi:MAG TPA: ABC transporter ATP-binding protein [Candidatus Dorea merdavium]|nr:ABC transporter ATP-binding protein [Candidatus Dorea merdavium]